MDIQNDNPSLGRGLESLMPMRGGSEPQQPAAAPAQPTPAQPPAAEKESLPTEAETRMEEERVWREKAAEQEKAKLRAGGAGASAGLGRTSKPAASGFGKLPASKMPEAIFHIEVDKISPNPHQPRRNFDETSIKELAASIREFGILQPLTVTRKEREVPTGTEVSYELISGERRLMAAKLLGLATVPAIVRSVEADQNRLEMAIIENIQREDLNPMEMARAMSRLTDEFRLTQREIAARLGKSREAVANTMRLLDLPQNVQKAVEEGKISESHGRLLLTVEDPATQEKLFEDLVRQGMSTRELKNRVRVSAPREKRGRSSLPPELRAFQERLSSALGAPVEISAHGESGRITISFYSEEELKNILSRLGREEGEGMRHEL